jgi:cyclic dehypoxanthinyl futalosine synthase
MITPAESTERIDKAEALELYRRLSIHELGRRAYEVCRRLHPETYRTYVVDRNINYSNICTAGCEFCDFSVPPSHPSGYVLTFEQIGAKIDELTAIGGTQILLQGGLVPTDTLDFEWYLDLLRFIKSNWPSVHVHGFSPPEVHALSIKLEMEIAEVLRRLRQAGLDTIPGGGAEILVDRVRHRIGPNKVDTDGYLEVMRQAHLLGMRTSATMMFGHVETLADRVEHLERIRQLQDETAGFTAFILWTFQPGTTRLGAVQHRGIDEWGEPDGSQLQLAGPTEYLKMLALARIFLDNVPNVQASWVTQGPKIGQLSLFFGANDMGSVMMEENVVSAAGTCYRLSEAEIRRLIEEAGFKPAKRNCYYELLESSSP